MSLVDYGSSDSEPEPQSKEVDQSKKRKPDEIEKQDTNDRPQKFVQLDNQDSSKLPPLPDIFDEAEESDHNANKTSTQSTTLKSKGSTLLPPQLWKKKANVTTEDTGAWNAERAKKTPPKPSK
mmetsp:Transcript_2155/g.2866  ORF Transcript_2155/g.2866 Transcript_2155/m.2866 type:complete len:123 (-) Transcript_2155:118-486(-)